jgi:hypothetical protein
MSLLSLLLFIAVAFGFASGSLWFFSAALGALLMTLYPVLGLLIGVAGLSYLGYRYYERKR